MPFSVEQELPLPSGTRVKSRIDGGGGAFAESTSVTVPNSLAPRVALDCCGPRPAVSSSVDILLRIEALAGGIPYPPDATHIYTFRITDPGTGAVIGSQTGTTIGLASFPPQVQRGRVIEMDVTPNDPRISVESSVLTLCCHCGLDPQSMDPGSSPG